MKAWGLLLVSWVLIFPDKLVAQEKEGFMEVYGFIVLDGGYNFNAIDPDWYDVMRPTKLPSYEGEFGSAGSFFYSIRQTRLGIRTETPTRLGQLKTRFDFDLFGFGADIGYTTFHLINAYAELGKFGAGQTASVFMDPDVFPVTLDYWGPCSRTFFFNIQVRYTPLDNERQRIAIALERPGATADGSDYLTHIDIQSVQPQFPLPNLTAHYRRRFSWGHLQAGGILKLMKWTELTDAHLLNLSGHDIGWGINASAVFNIGQGTVLKAQGIVGEGIQNYIADAPTDIALQSRANGAPFKGKALPVAGLLVFAEFRWTNNLRSSVGYSWEEIRNTNLQEPSAFRRGQYGLANLRLYPADNLQVGVEYQYGQRDNFSDGFTAVASKVQISFKANFSATLHSR